MASKDAAASPRRRRPREAALDSPNPVDIAMAAVASGKPMPDIARRVLEEQADLLHAQRTELRMRHVGEMVRAALWAILAVAALAIIVLIGAVLIRAAKSDALIVQSFRVPPALAAKGLTGEVVATQVLDKLAEMQEGTDSVRAASTYANNWEDELKIDIPNTGATTDQVWKVLRGWLGKETRISGEVIDTGKGLALTARVGAKPGQRFVNSSGDLDALVAQGAELIFKRTQPYRHAIYVARIPGREAERYDLLLALTTDKSPIERKWAYSGLSFDRRSAGQFRQAAAMGRRALAIDPEMVPALSNLADAQGLMGHDQVASDLYTQVLNITPNDEYDPIVAMRNRCSDVLQQGAALKDPAVVQQGVDCLQQAPARFSQWGGFYRALQALLSGDIGPALAHRPPSGTKLTDDEAAFQTAWLKLSAEMIRGPTPALAQALAGYETYFARVGSADAFQLASAATSDWQMQADALSMLGRHAAAKALIARTPLDCYTCVLVRGRIAKRIGAGAAAQRWFAEAAKQGPRLAPAYVDWGRLLLDHRRFAAAEVKLREAARLAPRWGEPLKYLGDLLAAQGKREEALTQYDAALRFAPKWQELRQARARVAG